VTVIPTTVYVRRSRIINGYLIPCADDRVELGPQHRQYLDVARRVRTPSGTEPSSRVQVIGTDRYEVAGVRDYERCSVRKQEVSDLRPIN